MGGRAWPKRKRAASATRCATRASCCVSGGGAGAARADPGLATAAASSRSAARGKRGPAFEKFKPFFCYVDLEGELFTIVKQTGSQRPAGRLWEDDVPTRLIFLGSLALGNEEEARAYGDDPRRDMAGVFERIAPFVWRLVIPFPQDGTKLQVFELTPVADQPKADGERGGGSPTRTRSARTSSRRRPPGIR